VTDTPQRKIIHVDMDCFYAAIEIRDNPSLAGLPVAVGGSSQDRRGVLCTCNYVARKYGVRSAMPTSQAYRLCPDLIVLPVKMHKYKDAAKIIHAIFREYTPLVEPLSLDEAYLEVTGSTFCQGSATLIAKEIRQKIFELVNITASAGVAPNKFLAKIASGWRKPDGLYVIRPDDVAAFVKELPVKELYGVGKVTAAKLHTLGMKTCADLQKFSLLELTEHFGKLGKSLHLNSFGIDNRSVNPDRIRKSLSVEETFSKNISSLENCIPVVDELFQRLLKRLNDSAVTYPIKNQFIKVKYSDFKQTTLERVSHSVDLSQFKKLLCAVENKENKPIRLLGLGVHFQTETNSLEIIQQTLLFSPNDLSPV
jgi:DNA polymerase-4